MNRNGFLVLALLFFFSLSGIVHAVATLDSPPIRFGATVSMEGQYQEQSLMVQKAFELWEHEINQKGGLLGRRVELVLYDDKSSKELVAKLYKKLIEDDRVDFVFSPYGTPLTMVASEVTEQHKFLMLACAASGETIWERGYQYVFGVYALANRYFIGLLDIMARSEYDTVSLIYNKASSFNINVIEGVKKWAETFRITIAHEKGYLDGEKELPAIVADLKGKDAKRFIVSAYSPDCYRLLRLMNEIDLQPEIMGMTIAPTHPDFQNNAGSMADRVFAPSQWEPSERLPFPGTKEFVSAFKRFTGKIPSYHAGSAYAACQLYEDAIRNSQSLDNEKARNYISALDTVTVIGRFKVNPSGKQIGHNPIIIQWQHGKKEIVWPSKMQTAPPLFSFP